MAGVMMAGALTQWNAAASNAMPWDWGGAAGMVEPGVPWDWGMGWGWAGWTPEGALGGGSAAAFCGSCALEQHHAAMYASEASHSASYNNLPDRYLQIFFENLTTSRAQYKYVTLYYDFSSIYK